MSIQISYMGTKRQLAPTVAKLVAKCPEGPLLDLFSGICAVGAEVSNDRQVWTNDAQLFATTVAKLLFKSSDLPLEPEAATNIVWDLYSANKKSLRSRFREPLSIERDALEAGSVRKLQNLYGALPQVTTSRRLDNERARLAFEPHTFPYRLFSITFAGGYVGISQAIEIDSLRYALDMALVKKYLSKDEYDWCLLALCQAVCKCSTTTGHFAQFIKINSNNVQHFCQQRIRSIWDEWLAAINTFSPLGNKTWRKKNRVFNSDAEALIARLNNNKTRPAVVYADPPYTADQYSRYYHVYETILKYDYPAAAGIGRYRSDRFSSPFSLKTGVFNAFENLVRETARMGSELIISYPENGLLDNSTDTILSLLRKHYRHGKIAEVIPYKHSSLGSSKGHAKYQVNEILFYAR